MSRRRHALPTAVSFSAMAGARSAPLLPQLPGCTLCLSLLPCRPLPRCCSAHLCPPNDPHPFPMQQGEDQLPAQRLLHWARCAGPAGRLALPRLPPSLGPALPAAAGDLLAASTDQPLRLLCGCPLAGTLAPPQPLPAPPRRRSMRPSRRARRQVRRRGPSLGTSVGCLQLKVFEPSPPCRWCFC